MKLLNMNIGFNLGTIVLGAAALVLGPMLLTAAGGVLRSLVKTGIKGGLIVYEKGKVMAEETRESLQELTEEAKSEIEAQGEKKVTSLKKSN